jgi:RHS repeat-associated protein
MEEDEDATNGGYDFGARIYNSQIGRWWSVDPLASKNIHASPYEGFGSNPIIYIDPDGRDIIIWYQTGNEDNEGNPELKYYKYNSEMEIPDNDFVKSVVSTIDAYRDNSPLFNSLISVLESEEEVYFTLINEPTVTGSPAEATKLDDNNYLSRYSFIPNVGNGVPILTEELFHNYQQFKGKELLDKGKTHNLEYEAKLFYVN